MIYKLISSKSIFFKRFSYNISVLVDRCMNSNKMFLFYIIGEDAMKKNVNNSAEIYFYFNPYKYRIWQFLERWS